MTTSSKFSAHANTASVLYILASVFLGPAIAIGSLGLHESGGDCYDGSWGSTPIVEREAYYSNTAHTSLAIAIILLGVGIVSLFLLIWSVRHQHTGKSMVLQIFLHILMVSGYALTAFWLATSSPC